MRKIRRTIIVTGTPTSGKTSIAMIIAKKINADYIDVNELIEKRKLSVGYDRKRRSILVDVDKLNKDLEKIIRGSKKNIVIDSHLSHYLSNKLVDLCIVTKCDLKELRKRLKKRGYHKGKIRENLDCEIFDVCYMEALALGHKIKVIDTSKGLKGIGKI